MTETQETTTPIALTRPTPSINIEEPWADDKMMRSNLATALTNLIKDQRHPFVISLDGKWGTGKTFFLQRWQRDLENQGFCVIYFNAWQDDFFDDPLIAMIAQIIKKHDDVIRPNRISIDLDTAYSNLQSVLSTLIGLQFQLPKLGDDLIKKYECQRTTIERLRNGLLTFLQASTMKKPTIFIVDELDRCRPDFAVSVLERTKHILDLPGLVFVYGINRRDLHSSARSIYGDIDTDAYFRRFFDMELSLRPIAPYAFCEQIAEQHGLCNLNDGDYSGGLMDATIDILAEVDRLSLRDIEHCIRIIAFVAKNKIDEEEIYAYVLVAIVAIRVLNYDLYNKLRNGDHVAGQAVTLLRGCLVRCRRHHSLHIEGSLYAYCDERTGDGENTAFGQLEDLTLDARTPDVLKDMTLLSDYTKQHDPTAISHLRDVMKKMSQPDRSILVGRVLALMDLLPRMPAEAR